MQHNSEYQKALEELLSLEFTGMKLGLDHIREFMEILGNPHRNYSIIHVAGSNGKGSVSSMLAAALQVNGYKTALYTSPHLVNFRERIKINGEPISEEDFISRVKGVWNDVERMKATFFETTTAIAFSYFADSKADVAVIETGLGGRLDATNIVEHPLASVITSISLEHTAQLGDTIELIAGEKAGIMKAGSPAIVNVADSVKPVFRQKAEVLPCPLFFVDESPVQLGLEPPFAGEHQIKNLRTVLKTLESITLPLNPQKNYYGIENTIPLTGLRGRLEEYAYPPARAKDVKLILDVAHNPDAFRQLKNYFLSKNIHPIVVAGFAKDKDIPFILKEISGFATQVIAVQAKSHRALQSDELAKIAEEFGLKAGSAGSPNEGIGKALDIAKSGDTLLLAGSHYVVGNFLLEVESEG